MEKVEQGWIKPAGSGSFSEAVLVHFNPSAVTVAQLVEIHLHSHSCTANHALRQKYRSAIYVFDELQGDEAMLAIQNATKDFHQPIITQILPFELFKLNNEEFLNYYAANPDRPFCKTHIDPKLKRLINRFSTSMIAG